MSELRYGVVGLQRMGGLHMRLAAANPHARLTAVCDIDAHLLKMPAGRFGAMSFTDHRAMIDANIVDAVSLAVPHGLHAPIALDFLRAGVHVLVEKPLAITPSQCDAMIDTAAQHDAQLAVMHQYRLHPLTQRMKAIIDRGDIGPVRNVLWTWHQFRTNAYFNRDAWRRQYAQAGGGIMMQHCIHDLDMLCYLLGKPVRVTAALATQLHDVPFEDTAALQIAFECGAQATVQFSLNRPKALSVRHITGDRGMIVVDDVQSMTDARPEKLRIGRFTPAADLLKQDHHPHLQPRMTWRTQRLGCATLHRIRETLEAWKLVAPNRQPFGYDTVIDRFIRASLGDAKPIVSGHDARGAVEIAAAALLSTVRGRTIDLPVDRAEYDRVFAQLAAGEIALPRTVGTPDQ